VEHDGSDVRGAFLTVPGEGGPHAVRKALFVDPKESGAGKTSFRCSFCGSDDRTEHRDEAIGREHMQVIVACASCGRQFAVLSAN
jgi:transcription elongation factor Elf1